MSTEYKSEPVVVPASQDKVYARFSNLGNLKSLIDSIPLDKIPEDKRAQLEKLHISDETISFEGGPTGSVVLRMHERRQPEFVSMKVDGIPMDLILQLNFLPKGSETQAVASILADIPMMMRPMVKGPLEKVVNEFANLIKIIPWNNA